MSIRVRYGLIAGVISLLVTACAASVFGLCGPVIPLIAGGVAGYLAVRKEMPAIQGDGGKAGAIAGAITGALSILGQIIAGILSLALLPSLSPGFSNLVPPGSESNPVYWLSGVATSFCIGFVGVLLGAAGGFAGGYFGWSSNAPAAPAAPPIQ